MTFQAYELFTDSCALSYATPSHDGVWTVWRCVVLDIVFVVLSVAFFVVSAGYVIVCDRLMK